MKVRDLFEIVEIEPEFYAFNPIFGENGIVVPVHNDITNRNMLITFYKNGTISMVSAFDRDRPIYDRHKSEIISAASIMIFTSPLKDLQKFPEVMKTIIGDKHQFLKMLLSTYKSGETATCKRMIYSARKTGCDYPEFKAIEKSINHES